MGSPGSDVYHPVDTYVKKNGSAYSIKNGKRDGELGIFRNTPGSGQYHPDGSMKLVKVASASWSMGS